MNEESVIELQSQLEESQKLALMKDEMIEQLKTKIQDQETKILEISKSGYEDIDGFIISHFQILFDECKKVEEQNEILKTKLLKAITKKHQTNKMLQALKIKSVPFSPKSPSGYEAENQKLNIQISDLQSEIQLTQEQLNTANEEIQKYKNENEQLKNDKNVWLQDATKHFNLIKAKLNEEREKMKSDNIGQLQLQNESLLSEINDIQAKFQKDQNELQEKIESIQKVKDQIEDENNSYKETIESLKETNQNMLNGQTEFLHSLSQIVGCQTLEESLVKVRELALLPDKCKQLQEKIDSIKDAEVNQSHDVVINALAEINAKLSPNSLKLPPESVLRQLFASLCNMFNAALNPEVSKKVLDAHVLSVVYQARNFVPSDETSPHNITEQDNSEQPIESDLPSFIQPPQKKQTY